MKNILSLFEMGGALGKVWAAAAVAGGAISAALGGWDAGAIALVVAMGMDYLLGIFMGLAGKSPKSTNGGLASNIMFTGLLKKICELLIVWLMVVIEPVLGVDFLRDAAVTGYLVTETLSIVENMAVLGVPMPDIVTKALDLMRAKDSSASNDKGGE